MTAMQELLKELNEVKSENSFIQTTINLIIDMVEDKLKKEKQQILDAYDAGNRKGYDENKLSASFDLDEKYYDSISDM